jgi:hypothetical protein
MTEIKVKPERYDRYVDKLPEDLKPGKEFTPEQKGKAREALNSRPLDPDHERVDRSIVLVDPQDPATRDEVKRVTTAANEQASKLFRAVGQEGARKLAGRVSIGAAPEA